MQTNVTVAVWFTQPAALGAGDTDATMDGAVRSILRVSVALAVLPALSVAVPVTT